MDMEMLGILQFRIFPCLPGHWLNMSRLRHTRL